MKLRLFSGNLMRTDILPSSLMLASIAIMLIGVTFLKDFWLSWLGVAIWGTMASLLGSVVVAAIAVVLKLRESRRRARKRARNHVFIIHAQEDLDAARKVAVELREHGFIPWLDADEIPPGAPIKSTILDALESSEFAVVLVSKHSSSKWVQDELKFALRTLRGRTAGISAVIPVRLDETPVPATLAHIQPVEFSDPRGMERLMTSLGGTAAAA